MRATILDTDQIVHVVAFRAGRPQPQRQFIA
jgi:hypothetical protein